jgi:CubicO group peptidase (beta-lactamase class C family)
MKRMLVFPILVALWIAAGPAAQAQYTVAPRSEAAQVANILEDAEALQPLKAVIVAHQGAIVAERGYRGNSVSEPTNIKSASKSIISALVGIAIDRGILDGVDQRIAPLLRDALPANPDPRIRDITIGHLLSMQAGLQRTSGANYGKWVSSPSWVRAALAQPFSDDPGGAMQYSTGSTHLLSAILTRVTNRSTLDLARDWLGRVEGFAITAWERDPEGIYLGGNQMAMSARSLLAFGELYRNHGRTADGEQVVPADWIDLSWQPRTQSRFTGDGYGYGWFLRRIGGHDVRYAWGFGGQMLYVVPSLDLTVVMTSDESAPAGRTGHRDDLHEVMEEIIAVFAGA